MNLKVELDIHVNMKNFLVICLGEHLNNTAFIRIYTTAIDAKNFSFDRRTQAYKKFQYFLCTCTMYMFETCCTTKIKSIKRFNANYVLYYWCERVK